MSLQWTVISYFLYFEVAVCFLLCVPLINSSRWHRLFQSKFVKSIGSYSTYYFGIFIVLLGICFVDAYREMMKYQHDDKDEVVLSNNPNTVDHIHMKLFRAQRNFYITGFALFLWFVISRLWSLISSEARLTASQEAAMKQAKSASDVASRLMADGKLPDGPDTEALRKELAELRKTYEAKERDFNVLREQSENNAREYDRLTGEIQELQNKAAKEGGDKKSE